MKVGGVDIYIEQSVGEKVDDQVPKDGEENRGEEDIGDKNAGEEDSDEEDKDDKGQNNGESSNARDEGEEEIIKEVGDDIPFQSLFGDIRDEEPPIPRESGCYIAHFSGRVFDVWGPAPQCSQEQPPQDS
ncbi:hypothetical protein F2Q68_00011525 [Brassica cretica]|uniref:Uncharacterized protein n=1 Tax=Brassica cretica TaxID=69181 RepID=A0A8S9KU07_BRACR|nr:hypothetical protein F2Q68_00011525 [Brassica cretica]